MDYSWLQINLEQNVDFPCVFTSTVEVEIFTSNAVFTSISQSDPLHLKNKRLENKLECLAIFRETRLMKNGNLK